MLNKQKQYNRPTIKRELDQGGRDIAGMVGSRSNHPQSPGSDKTSPNIKDRGNGLKIANQKLQLNTILSAHDQKP